MIGRAALHSFLVRRRARARVARCAQVIAVAATIALGGGGARAQSGFVLKSDALTSAGGSATGGAHVLGMSVGQIFTGAATGGTQVEHAGLWHPRPDPLVSVDPVLTGAPPARVELLSIAPNPTRGPLTFRLGIPAALANAKVELRIFDLAGRMVRQLHVGHLPPGWHQVGWNGRDSAGEEAGLGVYFCRIDAGGFAASRRFVVIQ